MIKVELTKAQAKAIQYWCECYEDTDEMDKGWNTAFYRGVKRLTDAIYGVKK